MLFMSTKKLIDYLVLCMYFCSALGLLAIREAQNISIFDEEDTIFLFTNMHLILVMHVASLDAKRQPMNYVKRRRPWLQIRVHAIAKILPCYIYNAAAKIWVLLQIIKHYIAALKQSRNNLLRYKQVAWAFGNNVCYRSSEFISSLLNFHSSIDIGCPQRYDAILWRHKQYLMGIKEKYSNVFISVFSIYFSLCLGKGKNSKKTIQL